MCDKLPPEMQAGITTFQAEAKSKVGDKGKQWKPGGQRR